MVFLRHVRHVQRGLSYIEVDSGQSASLESSQRGHIVVPAEHPTMHFDVQALLQTATML